MVYHDQVIGPMKKNREFADPTDDKEWNLIPVSFGANKERWSGSGMKCIHIDAHVNTCIFNMFKVSAKKIGALTNYIIERFQQLLKEHYVFHKKSIKLLKAKKYKAWRGANDVVPDYVLPEAYHIDHFKKVIQKAEEMKKAMGLVPDDKKDFNKDKVQLPTQGVQTRLDERI